MTGTVRIARETPGVEAISPDQFLAGYPADIRHIAEALRVVVRRAAPGALERVRPGGG